jgi:phosphatidylserine decarboxylase
MAVFAKEGYSNIIGATIIAVILCIIASVFHHPWRFVLYGAAVLLEAAILFFFRDPDRELPADDNLIIAPADGKIVSITIVDEPIYLKGKATQISIFLSLFDVHVNRLPATGLLEYLKYNEGRYLMAWKQQASSMNERADFGALHPSGVKIFFRQITGFLARRIVYHIEEGERLKAGERFGMMKFGSRMDILVPADVQIDVKPGTRTVGGETVLAHITKLKNSN